MQTRISTLAGIGALMTALASCQATDEHPRAREFPRETDSGFQSMVLALEDTFPGLFLRDALVGQSNAIERPTVFGEPHPPEGFAGPDPAGRHQFGIYVPSNEDDFVSGDISTEQWIVHEMFHLHNRRTGEYAPFIDQAFPDESDPLVQWIRQDPLHRSFAREEAFINLVTFADEPKTRCQHEAVQEWLEHVGAGGLPLAEIKRAMNVIDH